MVFCGLCLICLKKIAAARHGMQPVITFAAPKPHWVVPSYLNFGLPIGCWCKPYTVWDK